MLRAALPTSWSSVLHGFLRHFPLAVLALGGALAIIACSRSPDRDAADWPSLEREIRERFPHAPQLATATLAEWVDSPQRAPGGLPPVLLDARTPEEYAVSHLPGAHPAPDLATAVEVLNGLARTSAPDTAPSVVVYCSVGWRSSDLVQRLREHGFDEVWNLEGSIFRWANEGRQVVRDGRSVRQVHPFDERWGRFLDPTLHAYEPPPGEPRPSGSTGT